MCFLPSNLIVILRQKREALDLGPVAIVCGGASSGSVTVQGPAFRNSLHPCASRDVESSKIVAILSFVNVIFVSIPQDFDSLIAVKPRFV